MMPNNMPAAEQDQPKQEERPLRIMLLGKCGAGKSSSGNTILGREEFNSEMELTRVTKFCEKRDGKVEDMPVTVIDTPGLFETDREMDVIVREILMSIKLQEPGPHVFVVVIPLGRMTQEDQETNKLIETMFGPKVWDYTIVLFTHGDCLEKKTINDVITKSEENLRNFIRKCSGGFHVFNNKDQEDQKQVTSFLTKIQTLVALNGGGHYHTGLYPPKERKIREKQESILAGRNDEIIKKERQLKEHYQGGELEKKKRNLWRGEEKRARQEAENKIESWFTIFIIMIILAFVAVLISVVVQVPLAWLLVLAGLTLILIKVFPGISAVMSWNVKRKHE